MKIEAGKFYRRRDGLKQRVDVVWPDWSASGWCDSSKSIIVWKPDGFISILGSTHDKDLLSKWTEPKLRAWRPEEVPLGAWVRNVSKDAFRSMIIGVTYGGLIIYSDGTESRTHWTPENPNTTLEYREHSLDKGATWKPCGVPE